MFEVLVTKRSIGKPVALAIAHIVGPGQNITGNSWKTRWSRCDDIPGMSEEKLAEFFEPLAKAHHLVAGKEGHVCKLSPS